MHLKPLHKQNHRRLTSFLKVQLAFVTLFVGLSAFAYDPMEYESQNNDKPKQIENVGIDEKLGTDLNKLKIDLVDEDGKTHPISTYFNQNRPVIVSLVYFSCPSLCNLHLNGVLDTLKQLSLVPGQDYDLLAVSFDPREDSDLAAAKKFTYQEKYNFPNNGKGIHFFNG